MQPIPNVTAKLGIETVMKNKQYENFDVWVKNFSNNLPNIWNEKSAKSLVPKENFDNTSAIVIGRGPSIDKNKHLELLAKSNFKGTIICCDGKLIDALEKGVNPEKFPKFYVTTIDPYPSVEKYYDSEIVRKYGKKIKGIFSILTNPKVLEKARDAKIEINWIHSLFDYNEGIKSFNNISALMIRSKSEIHRLPGIQTGGNVGTASWFVSWQILKCSTVSLIGINHGWETDTPLETIIFHNNKDEIKEGVDRESPIFRKLYKKIFNPDFNSYCILDPLFQYYSEALKEFIIRSPEWVKTINCTEGGSIFGKRIKSMKFEKFLQKYS